MWVISDVISRKGGGGEDRGKRSFEFGEELTGNLGRQESNGPRGRAGILIELVSVRAGASKAWRTTERLLAGAGWDPPGKHPLGFPCKISLCIPGPQQASQPLVAFADEDPGRPLPAQLSGSPWRLWCLHPWRGSNSTVQTCSDWPCSKQGIGLEASVYPFQITESMDDLVWKGPHRSLTSNPRIWNSTPLQRAEDLQTQPLSEFPLPRALCASCRAGRAAGAEYG